MVVASKGHLKKCCKKSGNFPKDSNRQNNQSSPSTDTGRMNFASTALPQTEAEFFDEKGASKRLQSSSSSSISAAAAVPAYRQYDMLLKKFQGESK